MIDISLGNILQRLFFKGRLRKIKGNVFCEIGSGNGYLSNVLLKNHFRGYGYDLNLTACEKNRNLNKKFVEEGLYCIQNSDVFDAVVTEKFDIVLSSMVLEHLNDSQIDFYFNFCKKNLNSGGMIIFFVPACMKYYGIEDEIAGHYKRYEFSDFLSLEKKYHLKIVTIAGLTYPISNYLYRLSNWIVKKNESHKNVLSDKEKTIMSGDRNVKYKTSFPLYFKVLLNEITLFPFHLLQLINRRNRLSMVIYCEMQTK